MNASVNPDAKNAPFGLEIFEAAATFGRDALERSMRMGAEAAVRACRGAVAAQLEAAQAFRRKVGGGEPPAGLAASSEAAIAGVEAYLEKAIDGTRAAAEVSIESVGHALKAKSLDEWVGVQIDSATRMANLGLAQTAELARVVTDTSVRCAEPFKPHAGSDGKAG